MTERANKAGLRVRLYLSIEVSKYRGENLKRSNSGNGSALAVIPEITAIV